MIDLLYVAVTLVFFALMVAYAAACNRIGRSAGDERAQDEAR